VLEPGDLLYLPPGVAHEGTALDDDCMTWSVGFTQPTHAQLAGNFLAFLDMQDPPDGILEDKDLAEQQHPGELADASVDRVARVLAETLGLSPGSSFDRERVAGFVGRSAHFDALVEDAVRRAPARRLVDIAEVGQVVAFLVGAGASGMTGDTIYVDAGLHNVA
jgi:hypothetical protein